MAVAVILTSGMAGNLFSAEPRGATVFVAKPPGHSAERADVPAMPLSDGFKRSEASETGRTVVQLTSGNAFCYALYYYSPSFTADASYLVHHRAEAGQVQLHRLELRAGKSVQLTHGTCPKTQWGAKVQGGPWCAESGRGVLDHRSVLNVARGEVIYFTGSDGNQFRGVDVETLKLVFQLIFSVTCLVATSYCFLCPRCSH